MLFWRAVPIPRLDIYNPVILGDKEKGKTSRGACTIKCFAVCSVESMEGLLLSFTFTLI